MSELHQRPGKSVFDVQSIGPWELFFLIETAQVAVGLFSLPRVIAEAAGHSGWMALLLVGVVSHLAVWVMVLLLQRFGDQDLYGILRILLGTWVGHLLGGLFALYCLLVAILVSRTYIEVVQTWLFPTTSTAMFYLLLLVPTFYCATGGVRVLGRFGIITFMGTIWMTLFLIFPMQNLTLDHYFPVFDIQLSGLISASVKTFASIVGFELILILYPFLQKRKRALQSTVGAIWFVIFIYLLVTLTCIGFYSQGQLQALISPTLQLFQVVHLPIIERIEHICIATWSFLVVSTASYYIWAAGRFLSYWPAFDKPSRIYWVMLPVVLFFGFWPKDIYMLTKFEVILSTVSGITSLALPPLLLLLAMLLGKKAQKEPDTAKSGVAD